MIEQEITDIETEKKDIMAQLTDIKSNIRSLKQEKNKFEREYIDLDTKWDPIRKKLYRTNLETKNHWVYIENDHTNIKSGETLTKTVGISELSKKLTTKDFKDGIYKTGIGKIYLVKEAKKELENLYQPIKEQLQSHDKKMDEYDNKIKDLESKLTLEDKVKEYDDKLTNLKKSKTLIPSKLSSHIYKQQILTEGKNLNLPIMIHDPSKLHARQVISTTKTSVPTGSSSNIDAFKLIKIASTPTPKITLNNLPSEFNTSQILGSFGKKPKTVDENIDYTIPQNIVDDIDALQEEYTKLEEEESLLSNLHKNLLQYDKIKKIQTTQEILDSDYQYSIITPDGQIFNENKIIDEVDDDHKKELKTKKIIELNNPIDKYPPGSLIIYKNIYSDGRFHFDTNTQLNKIMNDLQSKLNNLNQKQKGLYYFTKRKILESRIEELKKT